MDDRSDPRSHPASSSPAARLASELSEGLKWMHDRAWPLGGIALALPTICLYHYTRIENVPLSLTSPALLSALPAVFAILALTTVMLSLFLIMPAFALSIPVTAGGPSLTDAAIGDGPRTRRLGLRWLAALAAMTVLLAASAYGLVRLDALWQQAAMWLVMLILCLTFPLVALGRHPGDGRWRDTTADFRLTLLGSALFQVLIVSFLLMAAIRIAGDRLWLLTIAALVAIVGVASIQIAAARLASALQQHPRPLAAAMRAAAVVVSLATLMPWVGGRLAGHAMQAPTMGGKQCVVLEWTPEAGARRYPAAAPGWEMHSAPLRILAVDGDRYLVRDHDTAQKGSRDTSARFIPRTDISGMRGCG